MTKTPERDGEGSVRVQVDEAGDGLDVHVQQVVMGSEPVWWVDVRPTGWRDVTVVYAGTFGGEATYRDGEWRS